jgi:hypothetical protein
MSIDGTPDDGRNASGISSVGRDANVVSRSASLPVFPGVTDEILPALMVLWGGVLVAFLVTREPSLWPVGVWASVTLAMLWPAGRRLGRPYLSYRRPAFVIAVLTMAYIPLAGFAIEADWSFTARSIVFFGLLADLTVFGIVASWPWAQARPIEMLFRPDLLFGDGRILATGVLSLVFGIRYMMGPKPPDALWALPQWEWYGILLAMVTGLVPLIAGRGMAKLLMRLQRVRFDRWYGWGGVILREVWVIATMLGIAFGFRHAFAGEVPFTIPVETDGAVFWQTLLIMAIASAWLVFVRGGYKKRIGEPFIREKISQTAIKELLLVAAVVPFFYAFMSMLQGRWLVFNGGYMLLIGLIGFCWGLLMLTLFRVIGQEYQRRGLVQQMAAVILPHQASAVRERVIGKLLATLLEMDERRRRAYLKAMNEGLALASDDVRALMTALIVGQLVTLPEEDRSSLVRSQGAALGEMAQQERIERMGDMMGAVSALPDDQRRLMIEEMAALTG